MTPRHRAAGRTPVPKAKDGFPASPDSEGVRRVALGNDERLPDKLKAK